MFKTENLNEKTEQKWESEAFDKSLISAIYEKAALAVCQLHADLSSSTVTGLADYLNVQVMREPENKPLMASLLLS